MESYPELLQTLLKNRGITTEEEAERFMKPDYERDLHDPFLILNMERAVGRILQAMENGERIAVWGDYDCDGIPGTVILHDFFKKIGYSDVAIYIPHRYREGYGLNTGGLDRLFEQGVSLVITVDSGITDVEPVAHASTRGMDIIVTDHHLPQENVPRAYAVLNSKQVGDTYPFNMLSGAGVAFKLVQALLLRGKFEVQSGWEKWLLDVAGISTIADMVPLVGENRALAHFGLKVLRRTPRPGLQALFAKSRVLSANLTEDDVGFTIAPRLNAASRMDTPMRAFELLSESNHARAAELANHLEKKNTERKVAVSDMIDEVDRLVHESGVVPVVVVGSVDWRPGVVGLAASRIVERYNRTAFVWGGAGSRDLKGSCRSDGTVHIVDLMQKVTPGTFLDFGGHAAAGGFSLARDRAHELSEALQLAHGKTEKGSWTEEEQKPEATLLIDEVTWELYTMIEQLAPFGMANPKPSFYFYNVCPVRISRFGKAQEHLKLELQTSDRRSISAISFFWGSRSVPISSSVSFIGQIEKSSWGGKRPELRLRLQEFL